MTELFRVNGSCHCGKIKLKGALEPEMIVACHCTDCQVFGGGPFRNNVMLKSENIFITGEVSNYDKIGSSGAVRTQGFCGNCGTNIYAVDAERSLYSVRAGFLEQHKSLVPAKHIFGNSAVAWLSCISEAAWFEEGPTSKKMKFISY
tara:strand:+ start:282 stop:722 length:441 start_codon:yes stop_codon:yes gene_type:complete